MSFVFRLCRRMVGVASLLVSCVQTNNAIFELTVEMPSEFTHAVQPGVQVAFGRVQAVTASETNLDFDGSFSGAASSDVFALNGNPRRITMVGNPPQFLQALRVRVDYCRDATCVTIAYTKRYEFARVFYRANYTGFTLPALSVAEIAAASTTMTFTKCQVSGCATEVSDNYCRGDRHLCE